MHLVFRGLCCAVLATLLLPVNPFAASLSLSPQGEQAGVGTLLWQAEYTYPGGQFDVFVHFPQGLSEGVDAAVAAFAKARFDDACAAFLSMAADTAGEAQSVIAAALAKNGVFPPEEEFSRSAPYFSVTNYQLHRPSPRYTSLHFMSSEYAGGAHGNRSHIVLSFDLGSGKRLEFDDLFADKNALPKLINRIADGVQALKAAGTEPVSREPAAIDANMDRIALTAEGLRVVYAPYEMGSYAEGEFIVDIPKAELPVLGIKADFWR